MVLQRLLHVKFTESARIDAAVRSTLYAGNISSAMERQSIVPLILSRDDALISALSSKDYTATSQRLISFLDELDVAAVMLHDLDGRVVASSERRRLGRLTNDAGYFSGSLCARPGTTFTAVPIAEDNPGFYFSRKIERGGRGAWRHLGDGRPDRAGGALAQIVPAGLRLGQRRQRADVLQPVVEEQAGAGIHLRKLLRRAGLSGAQLRHSAAQSGLHLCGRHRPLRVETKVGFQGWKLSYFETLEGVRARVNGILAFEIMVFAILTAFGFYMTSRASARDTVRFKRETDELRVLNRRLQEEIAERKKAEKNLEVAEQSLAQQSKLAALGQMSAAVAHELNQPLAAMRTYVAGSRLLMKRGRSDDAVSSFQRLDDLLDRMGALTRQLKSFARKSDSDIGAMDLRDPMRQAISMMSPQLSTSTVKFTHTMPDEPVLVVADPLRLEQIIVNLMRNALDAMKGQDDGHLDLMLTVGPSTAALAVRDTGVGHRRPRKPLRALLHNQTTGRGPGAGAGDFGRHRHGPRRQPDRAQPRQRRRHL